jgi:hypothetical protein
MLQKEWRLEDEVEKASLVLASETPVLVNLDAALECLCIVLVYASCSESCNVGARGRSRRLVC